MGHNLYSKYKYIGQKFQLKDGSIVEIVDYRNYRDVDVKIETGEIIQHIFISQLKYGIMRNPYKRNIFGRGYVGVGKYRTDNIFYRIWHHMFYRCYSPDAYKTYEKCEVCEEWYNYQTFAEWCSKNYRENFALDKDILVSGNKIYSPKTCCFVPQEINNQFYSSNFNDENFGIKKASINSYQIRIKKHGESVYLGSYMDRNEAIKVYCDEKEKHIRYLAELYKPEISEIVYNKLKEFKINWEIYNQ